MYLLFIILFQPEFPDSEGELSWLHLYDCSPFTGMHRHTGEDANRCIAKSALQSCCCWSFYLFWSKSRHSSDWIHSVQVTWGRKASADKADLMLLKSGLDNRSSQVSDSQQLNNLRRHILQNNPFFSSVNIQVAGKKDDHKSGSWSEGFWSLEAGMNILAPCTRCRIHSCTPEYQDTDRTEQV